MSGDDSKKVVEFPKAEVPKTELLSEEQALKRDVERLASFSVSERTFYLKRDGIAEKHGLSVAEMTELIEATIKANKEKEREDKVEERRRESRNERAQDKARQEKEARERREQARAAKEAARKQKEKDRAFAAIIKLPKSGREAKLRELAKKLGEDVELLRDELVLLAGDEEAKIESGEVEPWPEPVDTSELLRELETQFRRYIVVHREHVAVATVLWIGFAWCHAIATYSPMLVIEAGDASAGKTNASSVIAWLAPNAQLAAELRGPTLFRLVDRDHPTLIIDDAEQLLPRRPDLAQIVKVSWTRGITIPRADARGNIHHFDPFCPKVLNGIDLTAHLDRATQSRCITVKLLPKLRDEEVANFRYAIRDERFLTLQRKLKRWAADNMSVLAEAAPVMPEALSDRQQMNWELQFAIADLAGGDWPKKARAAAIKLSKREEPSQGKRLLAAFRNLFRQHGPLLTSQQTERLLAAYGDGEWANYKNGRPINKWEIAVLLKPYDLAPDTIHPRGRPSDRGYDESWFATAFRHFLPLENPSGDRAVVRTLRKKRRK